MTIPDASPTHADHVATAVGDRFAATIAGELASERTSDGALTVLLRTLCNRGDFAIGQAYRPRIADALLECTRAVYVSSPSSPGLERFRKASLDLSFERGGGVPGTVWQEGRCRWVEDVTVDRLYRRGPQAREAGLRTGFFIPVRSGAQVITVLELYAFDRRSEDHELVALVRSAAEQLAPHLDRRRLAEEAALLRGALDQMSEALVVAAPADEPVILFVSQAFERLTGWRAADVIGASVRDVLLDDDAEVAERTARAVRERVGFFAELETVRRDGTTFPCEWSISPTRAPTADSATATILLRDLTPLSREQRQRARLAESVRKSVVEWQRTFDAIETPIWLCELDGIVVRLNRHARSLSDRTYSATVGAHLVTLGTGEPWATAADLIRRVARSRTAASVQVRDEATARTWDVTATFVDGTRETELPRRVLMVARDISRLVTLQESLHRSETMATMGAVVAGVAHEVRNPLFGISATVDALELRLTSDSPYREYTEILRTEVVRLTNLMTDLLEYGRPPRLAVRASSIAAVIEDAVCVSSARAQAAGVSVKTHVSARVPSIEMDAVRVSQALRNLIENAVQHAPRGSQVDVSAEIHEASHLAVCTVRDHGPGFKEEDLPHVFEPFFTRRRGGVGLGLALVWRIVEEHGGTTTAGNSESGGALVTITLPIRSKREGST